MRPSFEQFVAALRDPALRSGIGLVIGDTDAEALLTRQDWTAAYYEQWVAMFPPEAAAPVVAPVATAVATTAVEPAAPASTPAAAPWQATPAAWQSAPAPVYASAPKRSKTPLVVIGSVLGVLLLAGVAFGVYTGLGGSTPTAHSTPITFSPSTTPTATGTADALNTHGLSPQEYELMEAAVEPLGHSLEEEIANGMTDAQLRTEANTFETQIDGTCTAAEKYPQGISNPSFKTAFISSYSTQVHITSDQATRVYNALVAYCQTKP